MNDHVKQDKHADISMKTTKPVLCGNESPRGGGQQHLFQRLKNMGLCADYKVGIAVVGVSITLQ